jgi:hypothetical protein
MSRKDNGEEGNSEKKVNVTLPGTVEKIIPAIGNDIPEKAEIKIDGAALLSVGLVVTLVTTKNRWQRNFLAVSPTSSLTAN